MEKQAKIIFISYLERPGGKIVEELRLAPIAKHLSQLINKKVTALNDCIGPKIKQYIDQMQPGEMVMLENTRFYPGEESDNDNFAKELASLADVMVEDAFGHCHRKHASTTGVPRHIPTVAGFYLEQEIKAFDNLMTNPKRPFTLIIGGTKTSDKIGAIKNLLKTADKILIGGAVANNFLLAKNIPVAASFIEEPFVDEAKTQPVSAVQLAQELLQIAGDKIILPVDLMAGDDLKNPKTNRIIDLSKNEIIPETWAFLDLGPITIRNYLQIINTSQTVFWDGPLGKYENALFQTGTLQIAKALADNKIVTVLAGGDTAAVAEKFDLVFKFTHVSIAGGAALEYLAGNKLPGIEAINNK